jgi:hypothetical protein
MIEHDLRLFVSQRENLLDHTALVTQQGTVVDPDYVSEVVDKSFNVLRGSKLKSCLAAALTVKLLFAMKLFEYVIRYISELFVIDFPGVVAGVLLVHSVNVVRDALVETILHNLHMLFCQIWHWYIGTNGFLHTHAITTGQGMLLYLFPVGRVGHEGSEDRVRPRRFITRTDCAYD